MEADKFNNLVIEIQEDVVKNIDVYKCDNDIFKQTKDEFINSALITNDIAEEIKKFTKDPTLRII